MTDGASVLSSGGDVAVARRSARVGVGERVSAGVWSAASLSLLVVSAGLEPARAGHGTHEQLGLPGCVWMATFDAPCPTCGMTTAFAHAADGEVMVAFAAQPLGAVLAVGAATAFWLGLHGALAGSRALGVAGRALGSRGAWIGLGVLLVAWVYKLIEHGG